MFCVMPVFIQSIERVLYAGKCSDRIVKQNRQNPCLQRDYVLVRSQCLIEEKNPTGLREDKLNVSNKNRHLILARIAKDFSFCSFIVVQ